MNRENIKKVRDHIARLPVERFAMDAYFGERETSGLSGPWVCGVATDGSKTNLSMVEGACNTCACIAGHALVALAPLENTPKGIAKRATDLLGLSRGKSGQLFEPNNNDDWFRQNMRLEKVTRAHAVRVLDHLLETGEVDWKSTRRAQKAVAK